jgi:hypothetical protein
MAEGRWTGASHCVSWCPPCRYKNHTRSIQSSSCRHCGHIKLSYCHIVICLRCSLLISPCPTKACHGAAGKMCPHDRPHPNARTVRMFPGPNLQGFGATVCRPRGTQRDHVSELHEAYLKSDRVADSRIVQKFHSWSLLHCHWSVAQIECASAVRPRGRWGAALASEGSQHFVHPSKY